MHMGAEEVCCRRIGLSIIVWLQAIATAEMGRNFLTVEKDLVWRNIVIHR
jgi:hypothetical protein